MRGTEHRTGAGGGKQSPVGREPGAGPRVAGSEFVAQSTAGAGGGEVRTEFQAASGGLRCLGVKTAEFGFESGAKKAGWFFQPGEMSPVFGFVTRGLGTGLGPHSPGDESENFGFGKSEVDWQILQTVNLEFVLELVKSRGPEQQDG